MNKQQLNLHIPIQWICYNFSVLLLCNVINFLIKVTQKSQLVVWFAFRQETLDWKEVKTHLLLPFFFLDNKLRPICRKWDIAKPMKTNGNYCVIKNPNTITSVKGERVNTINANYLEESHSSINYMYVIVGRKI